MAPEQLRGGLPETSWDVWALALMTYEMLTGYHPFATLALGLSDTGIPTAHPTIGRDTDRVLPQWQPSFARWLSFDPAGRPSDAGTLFNELEQMLRQS
jgi:serine/threonine protein kinase